MMKGRTWVFFFVGIDFLGVDLPKKVNKNFFEHQFKIFFDFIPLI